MHIETQVFVIHIRLPFQIKISEIFSVKMFSIKYVLTLSFFNCRKTYLNLKLDLACMHRSIPRPIKVSKISQAY